MTTYKRCVFCALVVLTLALGSRTAPAQDDALPVTDDDVNRIARQLYCPQCESITLEVCSTPACITWRKEIRQQLEAGATEQEIIDYFVAQYGQRVLAQPNDPLISFLLVLIPAAALVAAGVLVLRQWRKAPAAPPVSDAPGITADVADTDDYRARLERELDESR